MHRGTLVCVLVLLVVLVCALLMQGCRRHLPYLAGDAKDEFFRYIASRPDARRYEEQRSGVSDITRHPEKFFAIELKEPEHSDVARAVRANGGLITIDPMRRWIAENTQEMVTCNR